MKKFYKALSGVALGAVLLTGTGCAPSGGGSADGPVEITFSSWEFTSPGFGQKYLDLVEEFNASQDEVKVETISVPYPTYSSTLKTQLSAGGGADVMLLGLDDFTLMQDSGFLSDITEEIVEPASGFAATDAVNIVDDKRFGVIWNALSYALIINKGLLDQEGVAIPTDYASFAAAAQKLTHDDQFGFAFRNTMPEETGWWFDLSNWVFGAGGQWTDKSGKPTIDTPEVIQGLSNFRDFFANGYIPQGTDAATYRRMFWEGKVAMVIDNNTLPGTFLTENPDLELVATPNPFENPTNTSNNTQLAVNENSEAKEGAVAFINYILLDATQKALAEIQTGQGQAADLPANESLVQEKPWVAAYNEAGKHPQPIAPRGAELFTAQIRHAVLTEADMVLRQGKDPASAMRDAQKAVEAILQ